MDKPLYYLDFHGLYKQTTKEQRVLVRTDLKRDEMMEYKLRRQHNLCFFCGTPIDMSAHLDHLIPVYYGGDNRMRNLVAACRDCNRIKHTDQIEITNERTIQSYLRLIKAYERVKDKKYAYKVRRYQLYKVYRADLFRVLPKVRTVR